MISMNAWSSVTTGGQRGASPPISLEGLARRGNPAELTAFLADNPEQADALRTVMARVNPSALFDLDAAIDGPQPSLDFVEIGGGWRQARVPTEYMDRTAAGTLNDTRPGDGGDIVVLTREPGAFGLRQQAGPDAEIQHVFTNQATGEHLTVTARTDTQHEGVGLIVRYPPSPDRAFEAQFASGLIQGGLGAVEGNIDLARAVADDPLGAARSVVTSAASLATPQGQAEAGQALAAGVAQEVRRAGAAFGDDRGAAYVGSLAGGLAIDAAGSRAGRVLEGTSSAASGLDRAIGVAEASVEIARATIELEAGGPGGWNRTLNGELLPNTDYLVNGYRYSTDDQGRVASVSGELRLETSPRNGYQQGKKADSGIDGDQGGHLIASMFNGPGEALNLFPQNGNFNMGEWKRLENSWKAALNEGKTVEVKIDAVYVDQSSRPDGILVSYSINGGRPINLTLRNAPGGE